MKRQVFIKWGFRFFLLLILIGGLTILWVNHQIAKAIGTFTEVIDTEGLNNAYSEILIRNVQILSEDCSHFIPDQQVVLKDGIITAIQPDSIVDLDHEDMIIIDGEGQFLIPGLVDSHVHLRRSKNDLYLYLANGITGVREMSGDLTHLSWKEEIEQGAFGPRMFVASQKVNSKDGLAGYFETWTRGRINYATDRQAAQKIQRIHEAGFDAVKISTYINPEMYEATIKYAQQYNLPVIGHIPLSVGLYKVYDSGQIELAHIEEIVKSKIWGYGGYDVNSAEAFLEHLRLKSDSIALRLRAEGISVTTTLWLMESLPAQKLDVESVVRKVEIEYANPGIVEGTPVGKGWLPGNNWYEEAEDVKTDVDKRKLSEVYWNTYVKAMHIMTRALAKHEVLLMAGTDASGVPLAVPGFSLHDELASLSAAGLTNAQALYSATVAPGRWTKSKTGKIKEGYQADLLLLSHNPLEEIQHTRSAEAVFSGTYWIDKSQIRQILASVKKANDENRHIDISAFIK